MLVPSRELVDQTAAAISALAYYCNDVIRVVGLGGGSHAEQAARLADGAEVVIATPGRAVAHINAGTLPASALRASCDTLIVDEADLVLSYGGGADTKAVVAALPRICQSLLVSATLSPALNELKRLVLHSPVVLKLEDGDASAGAAGSGRGSGGGTLTQFVVRVGATDRFLLLFALIKLRLVATKALVFVADVDTAYRIRLFLERFGIGVGVLDATLPASARRHALESFNRGAFDYLIATEEMLEDAAASAGGVRDVASEDESDDEGGDDSEEEGEGEKEEEDGDDDTDGQGSEEEEEEEAPTGRSAKRRRTAAAAAEAASTAGKAKRGATAASNSRGGAAAGGRDREYGASRGLDFRGVATVVNFDFPASVASYTHRVGRTARGGASGVALSFLGPEGAITPEATAAEVVYRDIVKHAASQATAAAAAPASSSDQPDAVAPLLPPGGPQPLPFDIGEVEGFRYRVEDVLRGVNKAAVAEARRAELKRQMLASEALRAHFEDHPRDLALLSHSAPTAPGQAKPHLKDVPHYLLPPALRAAVEAAGGGVGGGRRGGGAIAGKKRGRGGAPAPAPPTDIASAAASGQRISGEAAIALASDDVYHARRNNVDPLRSLAASRAASSAMASKHRSGGGGGGGGGGRGGRGRGGRGGARR